MAQPVQPLDYVRRPPPRPRGPLVTGKRVAAAGVVLMAGGMGLATLGSWLDPFRDQFTTVYVGIIIATVGVPVAVVGAAAAVVSGYVRARRESSGAGADPEPADTGTAADRLASMPPPDDRPPVE